MIGAIIGDIVGSRFEFNNHRSTYFELFHKDCSFTDDTICTVAVADWLLQDTKDLTAEQITKIMRKWCRKYSDRGYGVNFNRWIWEDTIGGYDSFGNGSAMRVSPVAWAFDYLQDVLKAAEISAEISHNHPDGIKGAKAVADAIFMLFNGVRKHTVIRHIRNIYEYEEMPCCVALKNSNTFNTTCEGTIPVCLQCLQASTDFESAIRVAVSVGGDTDTIAAIVVSMAEAIYGIPKDIWRKAMPYLPDDIISVISSTFRD